MAYYKNTAETILQTLQNKANHLNDQETSALALLNTKRDKPITTADHATAEDRLADDFSAEFHQADNPSLSDFQKGVPFEDKRDVYTFCPTGSDVTRPVDKSTSLDDDSLVYYWGWSDCANANGKVFGAIRIQQIWVSNVKHPTITLQMVEDEQIGKTNLDLNLNDLVAGRISEDQILKAISPNLPDNPIYRDMR